MYSAPVSFANEHFTSPIAVEIIGNFAAKAPPNRSKRFQAFQLIQAFTFASKRRG